jgi:hypothetical protein
MTPMYWQKKYTTMSKITNSISSKEESITGVEGMW